MTTHDTKRQPRPLPEPPALRLVRLLCVPTLSNADVERRLAARERYVPAMRKKQRLWG